MEQDKLNKLLVRYHVDRLQVEDVARLSYALGYEDAYAEIVGDVTGEEFDEQETEAKTAAIEIHPAKQ